MLAIGLGRFAGKLLVGSKHRAQRIEGILAGFLAGAALKSSDAGDWLVVFGLVGKLIAREYLGGSSAPLLNDRVSI